MRRGRRLPRALILQPSGMSGVLIKEGAPTFTDNDETMAYMKLILLVPFLLAFPAISLAEITLPGTWANWRGPHQNGTSDETGLPDSWSAQGDNLVWTAPVGGISSPIVMGGRFYMVHSVGQGAAQQEQLLCLDAHTGETLWKYRFNIHQSDAPPHRVGWAAPVGDPETERIYVLGTCGILLCIDRDGKLQWERNLGEEFAMITTHGGRISSPIVYEDLVIADGVLASWGSQAPGGHRYLACDKMTGEIVWFSKRGGRPYDTTYATPIIVDVAGKTLLVDGGSDGAVHALVARTGRQVWHYNVSKRGINSSIVAKDNAVYVTHGEENLDTAVMGQVAAIDAGLRGDVTKSATRWHTDGLTASYSSPALAGNYLYLIDNGATLHSLDLSTGNKLWDLNLGTIQRASPVYADGKIYVGTQNGKFYILKPGPNGCEILDVDELGKAGEEAIRASVAVANGRIYLVSAEATYCIGSPEKRPVTVSNRWPMRPHSKAGIHHIQIVPTEVLVAPGENVSFAAKAFDSLGNLIGEPEVIWSLERLNGHVNTKGDYFSEHSPQAGEVRATWDNKVMGVARVRVIAPFPWSEDFESLPPESVPPHWAGAGGKYQVRELDGNKVLVKLANPQALLRRGKTYMGPSHHSNYTMEIDAYGIEKRRRMPDAGIIAQRYALVLGGNTQRVSIESWQPETERSVHVPFEWKPETWYRMKLMVETKGGKAIARGKVWARDSREPHGWMIEKVDPNPNLRGSPGIYSYALNEIFYDNIKVSQNPK